MQMIRIIIIHDCDYGDKNYNDYSRKTAKMMSTLSMRMMIMPMIQRCSKLGLHV
jgi:hypothetical protein